MSCLSDGDIECWRERNEKISIKYLEFLKGLERQRRGEGRGGAESCFSIWSYLVCRRPLGVGGAKKARFLRGHACERRLFRTQRCAMNWSAFLRFLGGAAVALGCASPLPPFWLFASRAPRFVPLSVNKVEVERNKGPFDDAAAISLPVRAGVHSFAYALYVSFYISRYK